VAQTHDELELRFDVDDREVDLLDGDRYAGVDGDQAGDVGIEVDVCFEIVDVELDAADG